MRGCLGIDHPGDVKGSIGGMQERAPGSGKSARNAAPGHRQDVELDLELTCAQRSLSARALLPVLAVWAQTSLAWLVLIGALQRSGNPVLAEDRD